MRNITLHNWRPILLFNNEPPMTATMLTQYNSVKGIKLFVKEGKKAVEVELKQLNGRDVM